MGMEDITGFIVQSVSKTFPLTNVIFAVIIILIILFLLHHFLDLAMEAWKLPFAIIIDAVDLMAFNNGYLDLAAAGGAFLLFWAFSKKGDYLSKIFAIVAVAESLIGVWFLPQYAFITNVLPLCTIFTLFTIKRR